VSSPDLVALHIADEPDAWEALGFAVADGTIRLGEVELRLRGRDAGRGLFGWSLHGATSTDLDGLETALEDRQERADPAPHPNAAFALDHVVVFTPGFDRTLAALEAAGFDLRRVAEIGVEYAPVRRAFYKMGQVVLEVVDQVRGPKGEPVDPDGPAFFWGIAVTATDVDGIAESLGDATSGARDAVQPGRRIVPLRRQAGLALPMAFMSPEPARR
jgi:hypothetical protein